MTTSSALPAVPSTAPTAAPRGAAARSRCPGSSEASETEGLWGEKQQKCGVMGISWGYTYMLIYVLYICITYYIILYYIILYYIILYYIIYIYIYCIHTHVYIYYIIYIYYILYIYIYYIYIYIYYIYIHVVSCFRSDNVHTSPCMANLVRENDDWAMDLGVPDRAKSHGFKMGIQPTRLERWWITWLIHVHHASFWKIGKNWVCLKIYLLLPSGNLT